MLATVPSATLLGIDGRLVAVEVHVSNGLPAFAVVGQPDGACREARDRVRAALLSSGITWPQKRITVNLAPAALRKGGAGLDLAMAVGIMLAVGELPGGAASVAGYVGELGLDGSLRMVPGVLSLVDALDTETVVVPWDCAAEAQLVGRHTVRAVRTLADLIDVLRGEREWPELPAALPLDDDGPSGPDLADVRGQAVARLAVEVAAAGGHHLLLSGPPGAGKSMLARRLPGLLPPLTTPEALEVSRVWSAAGLSLPPGGLVRHPPLRSPHHTASVVSLVGGGTAAMRPGEISLAHRGVLFMDELGEFPASVLETLRQPLEEGVIRISRARALLTLPARFLLVGAMNPCPCGQPAGPGSCRCSDRARYRYAGRLSGPLLDRFDLRVDVGRPELHDLLGGPPGECTAVVRARVAAARALALDRAGCTNAELPAPALDVVAPLTPAALVLLEHQLRAGRLSARGLHRVRRVARTLADLDGGPAVVGEDHLCLAFELRREAAFEAVPA